MLKPLFTFIFSLLFANAIAQLTDSKLSVDVRASVWPVIKKELNAKGFEAGQPLCIRIFKQEHILEIWIKRGEQYGLFKSYPVCFFSGGLGTKTHVNDGKSPEGFYTIEPKQLNPFSKYHLAINVGYPNQLEKAKGYTGTDIMIHGDCVSIGCYAMTDLQIDEIYTLVYQTFAAGQKIVPLSIFPFRLKSEYLANLKSSTYYALWCNMKQGYDLFEHTHIPPDVYVANNCYKFKYANY